MTVQYLIVIFIISGAVLYAGMTLLRKRRSFSTKPGCGKDDCGCK
jgi:hypothetical protein